jgi:DNA-binding response OmpR family regulator
LRLSPALASWPRVPTILLVEDEAFVRKVACETLCSGGYRVPTARNAADAVQAFHGHAEEVQLLLTDAVLPDRNGCALALELIAASGGVKAIFISGYPENSVTRKDAALASFTKKGLEAEHYAVDVSSDGEQARAMAGELDFDLVVLDLNLPRLDGVAILRFLRTRKPSMPILVLTGRTRAEDRLPRLEFA